MTAGTDGPVPLVGIMASQTAIGTEYASYTTAKSVLDAAVKETLPPHFLYAGHTLRISILMGVSNVVTAQPTFTFQVMLGTTVVWSSGAITTTITAHTGLPTELIILIRPITVGAGTAATMVGYGRLVGSMWLVSGATADFAQSHASVIVPVGAPAAGNGYDSTIENVLDFWVGISASNAGNAVQVFSYLVEDLN